MFSHQVCLIALLASAHALPTQWKNACVRRDVADLDTEYDYIVVGAGTAGTTVGDRLSEDGTKSVLMIEYGSLALDDSFMPPWNVPAAEFIYNIASVPQPNVNNRTFPVINGRAVGGASAVNGQLHLRGSKHDYDNVAQFSGNEEWNWDNLFPYFKKSSTLREPTDEMKDFGVTYDAEAWGNSTSIYAAFPAYQYPGQKVQWKAWAEKEDVEVQTDHANGNAHGVYWVPTAMDPEKAYNRSFAAIGHWLEVPPRSNYHLITEHRVIKVNLDEEEGLQKAVSVLVQPKGSNATFVVKAKKEIILSASAVRTPQILQLSGIGPRKVLEDAGIEVKLDLPGVGWNLQDHSFSLSMYNFTADLWPNPAQMTTNASFRAASIAEYKENNTGPWTAYVVSSGIFLPAPVFLGSNWTASLAREISSQEPAAFLPPNTHPSLIAGYAAQKKILHESFLSNTSAVLEHLFSGSPRGTAILLKPFSRGTITLNASDPLGEPVVDYRLLSNPLDLKLHIRMQQYLRNHFATSPALAQLKPVELDPGPGLPSDEDVATWLVEKGKLSASNAHQAGTAAMAPRELGGVVDGGLRVHGTKGLRVVDCSVVGLLVGAHTMATAYAIGEKAADLIKDEHRRGVD